MNYIGMDLHRRNSAYCVMDETGAVVARGKVESTEEGWSGLLTRWPRGEVALAVETGTQTWMAVDCARQHGIEPVVVDARQFKLVASSKKKSDRRDAFHLADALRAGLAQRCAVTVPSRRARSGRGVLESRSTVVKQCTISRNAALGLLRSIGLKISLSRFASEEHWNAFLAANEIPGWMRAALEIHRRSWKALKKSKAEFDAMVADELRQWPETERLKGIAGYGDVVTLAVTSSIDDPTRFRTQKQVASYSGMVPTVRASGDSTWRGGITHQGRTLLRVTMVQAAHAAMHSKRLSPALRKWALRLLITKGRQVAAVALGRRLLQLGYKLMRTGDTYDPNFGAGATA